MDLTPEIKEKAIKKINRKITRCANRIQDYESRKEKLNNHGHWSLGYFEGRKAVLEEILDELEAM